MSGLFPHHKESGPVKAPLQGGLECLFFSKMCITYILASFDSRKVPVMKTQLKDSPCYKLSRCVVGENVPIDNLRLEMNPESFYLFSYHHLEFAKFDSDKDRDTLMLTFLSHQVRIAGHHLRELAVAIQSGLLNPSSKCPVGTAKRQGAKPLSLKPSKCKPMREGIDDTSCCRARAAGRGRVLSLARFSQLSNRRQSSSGGSQSHRPRSGSSPMMGGGNGGGRTGSHISMMDE